MLEISVAMRHRNVIHAYYSTTEKLFVFTKENRRVRSHQILFLCKIPLTFFTAVYIVSTRLPNHKNLSRNFNPSSLTATPRLDGKHLSVLQRQPTTAGRGRLCVIFGHSMRDTSLIISERCYSYEGSQ